MASAFDQYTVDGANPRVHDIDMNSGGSHWVDLDGNSELFEATNVRIRDFFNEGWWEVPYVGNPASWNTIIAFDDATKVGKITIYDRSVCWLAGCEVGFDIEIRNAGQLLLFGNTVVINGVSVSTPTGFTNLGSYLIRGSHACVVFTSYGGVATEVFVQLESEAELGSATFRALNPGGP